MERGSLHGPGCLPGEKVKKFAELSGYSSAEEFVTHCLEKEISKLEESDSEEEIKKKLKGLGYIS